MIIILLILAALSFSDGGIIPMLGLLLILFIPIYMTIVDWGIAISIIYWSLLGLTGYGLYKFLYR